MRILQGQLAFWSSVAAAISAACCTPERAHAQSMLASMRGHEWATYIFVSTAMPRHALVELAREASLVGATLVLRGFAPTLGKPVDFSGPQTTIAEINRQCCRDRGPGWIVDPRLYERYRVQAVPAFVIARGEGSTPEDYSLVTGDMALANALKFIAQNSRLPAMRTQAAQIYAKFGGQP